MKLRITSIFYLVLLLPVGSAFASGEVGQTFTLDGRLYADAAATTPLTDPDVNIILQILNPTQDCVLYEETQSHFNAAIGNGYFTLRVGSALGAAKRSSLDSGNAMSKVYSNTIASISGRTLGGAACTYSPSPNESRSLRIQIIPSADGITRVLSPNMSLDSVPTALVAERAENLQGLSPTNLLQVNTSGSEVLSQSNLENIFSSSNYSALTALLAGSSGLYSKPAANGTTPLANVSSPASPAAGQMWYDSGAIKFYNGSTTQTLGVAGSGITSLVAGTGLNVGSGPGGTITSTGTLNVDTGTTAGQIVQVAAGNKLPVIDGSNLTLLNGSAINSGTIGGSTAVNTTGNIAAAAITATGNVGAATITTTGAITATGNITGAVVTGTSVVGTTGSFGSTSTGQISLFDHPTTNTNYITLKTPATASLTSDYVLTLPDALPASAGQVLTSDMSGKLTWTSPSSGSVTSVGGTAPITISGTGAAPVVNVSAATTTTSGVVTLAADGGTTASTVVQATDARLSDARLPSNNSDLLKVSAMPANCAAGSSLTFSSPSGSWVCTTIPDATASSKGIMQVGTGLSVASGTVSLTSGIATPGTYSKVTVDTYGRVTTTANIGSSDVTTALGFTPLNRAGDVMTGAFGLNPISTATETTLVTGFGASDKGKMWFNTDLKKIHMWDGAAVVSVASPAVPTASQDGQSLKWNNTSKAWEYFTAGVSGSGIGTFNTLTGNTQTLANGTAGTAPGWVSSGSTHTLNIPMASTSSVTAGLISKTDYDNFNGKISDSYTLAGDVTGTPAATSVDKIKGKAVTTPTASGQMLVYDGTNITPVVMSSDATMLATGAVTLKNTGTAGTYYKVTTDAQGRVTSGAASLLAADIPNLDWAKITTGTPTTLLGYGITDAVKNAGGAPSVQQGSFASMPAAGTAGRLYVTTDTKKLYRDNGTTWDVISPANAGTVTSLTSGGAPVVIGGTAADPTVSLSYAPVNKAGDVMTGTFGLNSIATAAETTLVTGFGASDKGKMWFNTDLKKIHMWDGSAIMSVTSPAVPTASQDGQSLKWNNTSKAWEYFTASTSSGIGTFNTLTNATQTLANGSAGTAPGWVSSGSTHTLNIPMASTSSVTAGLISKTDYDNFNGKISDSYTLAGDVTGTPAATSVDKIKGKAVTTPTASGQMLVYDGTNITPVVMSSDATMLATGAVTLKNTGTAGTYYKVTTDAQGRVTSGVTSLTSADLTDAGDLLKASNMPATCSADKTLTFSSPTGTWVCSTIAIDAAAIASGTIADARLPASAKYWTAATGGINYSGGNVGVGTTTPGAKLEVVGPLLASTATDVGLLIGLKNAASANQWNMYNLPSTDGSSASGFLFENCNPTCSRKMTISQTGNVGIGVASPSTKLDVAGSVNASGSFTSLSDTWIFSSSGGAAGAVRSGVNFLGSTKKLSLYTDQLARMTVDASGNVGVGTTSPAAKMHIEGGSLYLKGNYDGTNRIVFNDTSGGKAWEIYPTTATGLSIYNRTDGFNPLTISNSNFVGVGTTAPAYRFQAYQPAGGSWAIGGQGATYGIYGSGDTVGIQGSGGSYYGYLGYSAGYSLYGNGSAYVAGTYTGSDRRLKDKIENLDESLDKVLALRPVSFFWKPGADQAKTIHGRDYGFIAQEIETVIPEIVKDVTPPKDPGLAKHEKSLNEKLGTFKTVEYTRVIPFLAGAIQKIWKSFQEFTASQAKTDSDQTARIKNLEAENGQLKARLEEQQKKTDAILKRLEKVESRAPSSTH